MKTKEEITKKIERLEQEHIKFNGIKMSECGCCSSIIDKLKREREEISEKV